VNECGLKVWGEEVICLLNGGNKMTESIFEAVCCLVSHVLKPLAPDEIEESNFWNRIFHID
jgi:hypothetical protein